MQEPSAHTLSQAQLRDFFLQFQVLFSAGVPIVAALDSLGETHQSEAGQVASGLADQVRFGKYLSQALGHFPESFDRLTCETVRLGEESGRLGQSLQRVADSMEWRVAARRRLVEALAYPAAVISVSTLVVAFMSHSMLPRILPLITSLGVPLPLPTRILMILVNSQWLTLSIVACLLIAYAEATWGTSDRKQRAVQWLTYHSPLVGRINRLRALSQVCRDLAMVVELGLPFVKGLRAIARGTGDRELAEALETVCRDLANGTELETSLKRQKRLPRLFVSSAVSGMETGHLPKLLEATAQMLDLDAETATEQLVQVVEPVTIAFLGLIVGGILLACFLPLYSLLGTAL